MLRGLIHQMTHKSIQKVKEKKARHENHAALRGFIYIFLRHPHGSGVKGRAGRGRRIRGHDMTQVSARACLAPARLNSHPATTPHAPPTAAPRRVSFDGSRTDQRGVARARMRRAVVARRPRPLSQSVGTQCNACAAWHDGAAGSSPAAATTRYMTVLRAC